MTKQEKKKEIVEKKFNGLILNLLLTFGVEINQGFYDNYLEFLEKTDPDRYSDLLSELYDNNYLVKNTVNGKVVVDFPILEGVNS